MFELAILYIIFNMATSNLNEMSNHNKENECVLIYFFENVNFILSVGCNNEKKSKLTLKFIYTYIHNWPLQPFSQD